MKFGWFLVLPLLLAGCSSEETGSTPGPARRGGNFAAGGPQGTAPAVSVRGYQARRESISTHLVSNTTLESIRKVTVYAKLNAIVQEILVEEGDSVREGQVLLGLEDREIRNEFKQAQIALEQARLALGQAEVRAQQSLSNYERALSLFDQKLISRQEYDQAILTSRTDELDHEAASEQFKAAQARVEAAQIQLEYTQIRSSISGVITERLVYVGDRVNTNEPVFTVEDLSVLWARIFIPERNLHQIRGGQRARLRTEAVPGQEFEASVKMINPAVDPASGTVKVTLELRDRSQSLRPGMFGTVYIATETHEDAVVIPKKAMLRERDQNRVFVIGSDGTVVKREVTLGFSDAERVEILSGVDPGEVVVTVGHEGLNEGYPVAVVGWDGPSPEGPVLAAAPVQPPAEAEVAQSSNGSSEQANVPPRRQRTGGFGQAGMDPDRTRQFRERLLSNPEVRKEYESRLEKDPALADDPEKQRAFFREVMQRFRGNRVQQ